MNGLNFDLAALAAFAFLVAVLYLGFVFWKLRRSASKPFDYEVDAPEFSHAKECHLKVLK